MIKKRINIVMGGPSAEHEISLQSGREVLRAIDRDKYMVKAVVISRDCGFYFRDIAAEHDIPSIEELSNPATAVCLKGPFTGSTSGTLWDDCDVAFLALHGSFGEDGVIQGFLESIGVPYTGSGVYASAVAMNKITSKYLFHQSGLTVPEWVVTGPDFPQYTAANIVERLGLPCFVKCPQSGSSKLMGRAATKEELEKLLAEYAPFSTEILVEKSITGIEFTCGVLDDIDGASFALPPIEIRPHSGFFDYTAKYTAGASDEIVPAQRGAELLKRVQDVALRVHRIIGCRGISRTDMIFHDDALYVLETNTLPGLTANSLIPKSFRATGGTFTGLIDLLIGQVLNRKRTPAA